MAPKRKPGASIPDDARHTVKRTLRLTPAESAALDSVAEARGVNVSRAVGALAVEAKPVGATTKAEAGALRVRLLSMAGDALVLRGERWAHVTKNGTIGTVHLLADDGEVGDVIVQTQQRIARDPAWQIRQATARHVANMDPLTAVALLDAAAVLVDIVCDGASPSSGKPEVDALLLLLSLPAPSFRTWAPEAATPPPVRPNVRKR